MTQKKQVLIRLKLETIEKIEALKGIFSIQEYIKYCINEELKKKH